MLKQTALHSRHQALDARLVDFSGWHMPIQYASQLDEHDAVRSHAGMFDVGHMCAVDVQGSQACDLLQHLLANDVAKLKTPGKALYSCMLNPQGGVIDDLIVYFYGAEHYRVVVNAGTADKDLAWLRQYAVVYGADVRRRDDLGILAVQGPQARVMVAPHLPAALAERVLALQPFSAAWDDEYFVGRTGYTGEDGFELILPHEKMLALWDALMVDGVRPCGLGARDTLRLEAGMNLYGQDMDETVTPLECGLDWTVAWSPDSRHFIGRDVVEAQRGKALRRAVGLVLEGRGVMRAHMPVRIAGGEVCGETTSGGFAPTLKGSIALARVDAAMQPPFEVEIRGQWQPVRVVKPPFVRNGTILV